MAERTANFSPAVETVVTHLVSREPFQQVVIFQDTGERILKAALQAVPVVWREPLEQGLVAALGVDTEAEEGVVTTVVVQRMEHLQAVGLVTPSPVPPRIMVSLPAMAPDLQRCSGMP